MILLLFISIEYSAFISHLTGCYCEQGISVTRKDDGVHALINMLGRISISKPEAVIKAKAILDLLLKKGLGISRKMSSSETIFHGTQSADREFNAHLIANGAHVNAEDNFKNTPLFRAVWSTHMESIQLMIAKGADVYAKSESG